MNEFLKAVGSLLIECGASAQWMDRELDNAGDALREKAAVVVDLLPALTGRPIADQAAVNLMVAGNRLIEEGMADQDFCFADSNRDAWRAAERQAMAALGIVPLEPAKK
jgi:hypothetical protein